MVKTKKFPGGYLLIHNSGHAFIEKAGKNWIVTEFCTGEIFTTTKTKKAAIDWIIGTFGIE
jgi:hypothetical protein